VKEQSRAWDADTALHDDVVHDLDELVKRADRYIAYLEHEIVRNDMETTLTVRSKSPGV
jgi:hypothetical protein